MRCLVTALFPQEVMSLITERHEVESNPEAHPMERVMLLRGIGNKDGLLCTITDRIDEEVLKLAPDLKVIANCGVGFDNIDVAAAAQRGIPVTNTPGVLTDATADLALALILAITRRVVEGDKRTRAGKFQYWAPLHFLGGQITGKTIGIVGLGRIGEAVARRAAGFDMKVIYCRRQRLDRAEEERLDITFVPFEELLRESDVVTLHVPYTRETHHLIGEKELRSMKPTSYLINTARGSVVDEKALVEALRQGWICGAGLDVYENEPRLSPGLVDLDNVVLLPHMGSATIETRTRMALMAAENLLAGLRGERPPNCLNWDALKR